MASALGRWASRMAGRLWWAPVVVVGLAVDRGSRARWLLTPTIVVLTACASSAAKLVIRRPRPGVASRAAPPGRLGAAGFPSTHTACAFAIAGWLRSSRQSRALHLVAVAIGYLRIRRRAHHLGDVVAGAALGYGIARKLDATWSDLLAARAGASAAGARSLGGTGSRPSPTPPPRHRPRRRIAARVVRDAPPRASVRVRGDERMRPRQESGVAAREAR
jgi:membrane-associated phospholipid phosphatase